MVVMCDNAPPGNVFGRLPNKTSSRSNELSPFRLHLTYKRQLNPSNAAHAVITRVLSVVAPNIICPTNITLDA